MAKKPRQTGRRRYSRPAPESALFPEAASVAADAPAEPGSRWFSQAKQAFDEGRGKVAVLPRGLVPSHGTARENIPIRSPAGEPLEEYYKWQFISGLVNSGMYPRDHVGAEVWFPKGSKGANPLKIDAAVFDDPAWLEHYNLYWHSDAPRSYRLRSLQWLNDHLIAVVEFKRDERDIATVFAQQVKPAMREKDPSGAYIFAMYYDRGRLWLFSRRDGKYLRYDEAKNQKEEASAAGDLSLHLPDPYAFIPSFEELRLRVHKPALIDRANRTIRDLDVITSIATVQVRDALNGVLRVLDKAGLVNQRGYEILIQTFALKIFDEKRNERTPQKPIRFYVTDAERDFHSLRGGGIQGFIGRMKSIREEALGAHPIILQRSSIDWSEIDHIRAIVEICNQFQDFSFARSSKSDLYQIVFHNFASRFQQHEKAQFLTPLPVIDFLVKIVNPRQAESVFDPCCGIGDFLSLAFVNAQAKPDRWKLDDANMYGADVSGDMIALSSLNMLLNGDGRSHLFQVRDKGSILWKIKKSNPPETVELIPERHRAGNWHDWPDKTRLMEFDVILTNPPFGQGRPYRPETDAERAIIEMYETWSLSDAQEGIDLGVVFLENAYQCLKENGRLGIVLSDSIASTDRYRRVREWLLDRMRLVACIDLPPNVFAETGINTTLLVAYKPGAPEMERLNANGYEVFAKVIKQVGYEMRTSKRTRVFNFKYRIDETTFEVVTDADGNPVLDEDFTEAQREFRQWAQGQEATLQRLFLKED